MKVLVSAYACNPSGSLCLHPGEDLTGWRLMEQLARFHELWVITHRYNEAGISEALKGKPLPNVRFYFLELSQALKWLYRIEFGQRIYYYLWQCKAWRVARKLHRTARFEAAHHLTFGNDWIPSFIGAFLPVPFLWGPVGGGQRTPKPLLKEYSLYGRFAEAARNCAQGVGRRMFVRRLCLKKARAVLVCNRETRAGMPARYSDKILYFPVNGIAADDFDGGGPESRRNGGPFRVVTAGRLHRLKGFSLAVRAFGAFSNKHPESEMVIIGEGPEERPLRGLISDLGLRDRVRILPWFVRREVLANMRSSNVFLFPSFRDGGGAVVVEAMGSGVPVVVLDSGGPGAHVEEAWGIKVTPGSPDSVVQGMASALETLYADRVLRRRMGDAGRKRAMEFYVWDRLGDRLFEIYRKFLIAGGPEKGGGEPRRSIDLGARGSADMSIDKGNKASTSSCPACGRHPLRAWFVKENAHGRFPIMVCPGCGSAFVWPRPSGDDMESFYRDPSYKNETIEQVRRHERSYHPDASMDAVRIITRCRRLAQGRDFLDIGAGFGEFSRAAVKFGMNVTACEPNGNSRRVFAEINGFEPEASMFDADYAWGSRERFDVALASQVLEHVPEPGAFVENLGIVLRPGGIAAIAAPHFGSMLSRFQGKKDMFISPPEHMNFFSSAGLVGLFERMGFERLVVRTFSKVNCETIEGRLRWAPLRPMAWRMVYGALRVSDALGRGMVLNAYFRKPKGPRR